MATLKHDIIGRFPPRTQYGLKGDNVKIISLHGHVFIVEGPPPIRMRFNALADDLDGVPEDMLRRAAEAQAAMKIPVVPPRPPETPALGSKPKASSPRRRSEPLPMAAPPSPNQGSLF
jgi:hypothetical protein